MGFYAPGTTNLVTNGGFETNTTGWSDGAGVNTLTRSTEQAKIGVASAKLTRDAAEADSNCGFTSITLGSAVLHTFSSWVYIPTAFDGTGVRLSFGGSFTGGVGDDADADLSLRDQWQRISATITPDPADLSGLFVFRLDNSTGVKVAYADGVQVEEGTLTPYVETDGATATRPVRVGSGHFYAPRIGG